MRFLKIMKTPPVITSKGRKTLGEFLKKSREDMNLSLDAFLAKVKESTGQEISKSTLSELERGNSVPKWDTLSILAWGHFYINPLTGDFCTASELFEIACEYFDQFSLTYADQIGSVKGSEADQKRIRSDQKSQNGSVSAANRNGSERTLAAV
jgi:transcriptional regulator with XRE-family HTH domain